MKTLYLISNYITAIYELDEKEKCLIKNQHSITIEEAMEKIKKNSSVAVFGIIRASIKERLEDGKWVVLKQLIHTN